VAKKQHHILLIKEDLHYFIVMRQTKETCFSLLTAMSSNSIRLMEDWMLRRFIMSTLGGNKLSESFDFLTIMFDGETMHEPPYVVVNMENLVDG
jgi:hypothetical protein